MLGKVFEERNNEKKKKKRRKLLCKLREKLYYFVIFLLADGFRMSMPRVVMYVFGLCATLLYVHSGCTFIYHTERWLSLQRIFTRKSFNVLSHLRTPKSGLR